MEARTVTKRSKRLSRRQWLATALDILAAKGGGRLSIEHLVAHLNVSRGSFYWHFKNREDFVTALAEHWADTTTRLVPEQIDNLPGDARARLLALMNLINEKNLTKYDIAVRAWAAQEPAALAIIENVDRFRFNYVRSLFSKMGFIGEELQVRAKTFVVYTSMSNAFAEPWPQRKRRQFLLKQHEFFTRKPGADPD